MSYNTTGSTGPVTVPAWSDQWSAGTIFTLNGVRTGVRALDDAGIRVQAIRSQRDPDMIIGAEVVNSDMTLHPGYRIGLHVAPGGQHTVDIVSRTSQDTGPWPVGSVFQLNGCDVTYTNLRNAGIMVMPTYTSTAHTLLSQTPTMPEVVHHITGVEAMMGDNVRISGCVGPNPDGRGMFVLLQIDQSIRITGTPVAKELDDSMFVRVRKIELDDSLPLERKLEDFMVDTGVKTRTSKLEPYIPEGEKTPDYWFFIERVTRAKTADPDVVLPEDRFALRHLLVGMLTCTEDLDIARFFRGYVEYLESVKGDQDSDLKGKSPEEAARSLIGWLFGEGMSKDLVARWHKVTKASHPVFGITIPDMPAKKKMQPVRLEDLPHVGEEK